MSCPHCGSINLNYQNGGVYCPKCRKLYLPEDRPVPTPLPNLRAVIEAALYECDGRCCDNAQDRAVIAGIVAQALRTAQEREKP